MKTLERLSESWSVGRRFVPLLGEHRRALFVVALLSMFIAAAEIVRPWPIQWVFDGALSATEVDGNTWVRTVWISSGAYLGIVLLHALFEYVGGLRLAEVGHMVTRNLRYRVFAHLTKLSPLYHAKNKSGDLLVRLMGDVSMLRTMLVDSSVELFTRGIWIVGTLAVMFVKDALLTVVLVAVIPLIVLVARAFAGRIQVAVGKQRRKESVLADYMHEAITATETIQSLGGSEAVVRRFARNNRTSERAGLKAKRLAARLSASVQGMLGCSVAMTILFGSYRVASQHITPGELLVFIAYVRGLLKPIRSLARNAEKMAKGSACGRRVLEILDAEIDIESLPDAIPAPAAPRELGFEGVSFRYDGQRHALTDFRATFRRGELCCLFGKSGAGKSTVAALAVRLHDPEDGVVRLDGRDLRDYELESLRERFGLCLQRTALFGDTIRENLLLGKPEATEEELAWACRAAGLGDSIEALPDGLDTLLGSLGAGLSGGQSRRLALARTLLRRSAILIVDEPFAGLDHAAVEHVRSTLREYARDHIVVVIGHELEHLQAYDRIVVIRGGRAVTSGSHAELLESSSVYREMVCAVPEVVS